MESNSFNKLQDKVRAFTFQDPEIVYGLLVRKKDYIPDGKSSRERHNYEKDIEQLNGMYPIWCFANKEENFTLNTFMEKHLYERFRCEMSLSQHGLSKFVLVEFDINSSELKRGLTHNAYLYSQVFSELRYKDMVAVYTVSYVDHWYFPKFTRVKELRSGSIFEEITDFYSLHLEKEGLESLEE